MLICLAILAAIGAGFAGCAILIASVAQQTLPSAAPSPADAEQSNVVVRTVPGVGRREFGLVDGVDYCVVKAEHRASIGDALSQTRAGGQFVIVRLAAENSDRTTHSITLSFITLLDGSGREYSSSSDGQTALVMSGDKSAELLLSELQPSVAKQVSLVYDIPAHDKGLRLKIPHGTFTGGQDAVLNLP